MIQCIRVTLIYAADGAGGSILSTAVLEAAAATAGLLCSTLALSQTVLRIRFSQFLQVKGRAVVPGTALLEASAAAAALLLPAEQSRDAALASIAIVAPLLLGAQVYHTDVMITCVGKELSGQC